MAIYLRLPPGSEGTSVPAGQPMEPTLAGPEPIEPPERRMSPQLRPGCLGPGLFKSANGWSSGSEGLWEM